MSTFKPTRRSSRLNKIAAPATKKSSGRLKKVIPASSRQSSGRLNKVNPSDTSRSSRMIPIKQRPGMSLAMMIGGPLLFVIGAILLLSNLGGGSGTKIKYVAVDEMTLQKAKQLAAKGRASFRKFRNINGAAARNRQLDEAKRYFDQALQIYQGVRDRYPGENYNRLDSEIADINAQRYDCMKLKTTH